jgi:putative RecB family exonuclease
MTVYSHSRLRAFEDCPRKYWYNYIEKPDIERPDTIEAFLGKCVHEALEELYNQQMGGRLMSADELLAWYEAAWDKAWHDGIVIVSATFQAADYREVGRQSLLAYYRRYQPFNGSVTLGLETLVRLNLDGDGKYKMQGYIDRLGRQQNGTYEIHDYKTSRHLPTQAEADADRQLALYQIALADMWDDVREVDLIWHYVRFDQEIRSHRSAEQLQAVRQSCISLIDDIEARGTDATSFPTSPSNLCDWCDFRTICPAMRHAASLENLPPAQFKADDGVKLVDAWVALRDQRLGFQHQAEALGLQEEDIQKQVIQFAQQQGLEVVRGSSHQAQVRQELTLDCPKANDPRRLDFENALRRAGAWDAVSAVNPAKLLSLWRNTTSIPTADRALLSQFVAEQTDLAARLKKVHQRED